jgi:hypothetical protein
MKSDRFLLKTELFGGFCNPFFSAGSKIIIFSGIHSFGCGRSTRSAPLHAPKPQPPSSPSSPLLPFHPHQNNPLCGKNPQETRAEEGEMSVHCTAQAARALAALPVPIASLRRRASGVSLSPFPIRRAPAVLVRATDSSSPPAAAQPRSAAAGNTVVPDTEFSLAKVSGPAVSWFWGKEMVTTPWQLSRRAIVSLVAESALCRCRSAWLGWGLGSRYCREFRLFPILCCQRFRMLCFVDCKCNLWTHVLYLRYGFGSYFNLLPGSEWSALLLTYGFPLTIIGMALKARNIPYICS